MAVGQHMGTELMTRPTIAQAIRVRRNPALTAKVGSEDLLLTQAPRRRGRFPRLLRRSTRNLTNRLHRIGYPLVKRLIDLSGSVLLLVALLPLCVVVAALIKLTDGGPVLFWQKRVGRKGREFAFPKFRSMVPDAERLLPALLQQNDHKDGVLFKMKADPRVTWIGRIIRRSSIDELPQLWCVLKGDMSLVGPRPALPREVSLYNARDQRRLEALPGLTCIWQVSGRSLLPFPKQVEMDLEYIEKQSFWLDIKLLFRTIPAVLFPKGAY
jgi:lipopolysaccharide/colanic/teichoic acid biosynthesis glycosyltransferase